jgi:hypothetical protein
MERKREYQWTYQMPLIPRRRGRRKKESERGRVFRPDSARTLVGSTG